MNRKLVYSLSIFIFISFLYFLNPQKIFAYCWTSQSMCEGWVGYPPSSPVCCHNTGGCSSPCGQIGWYDYCKFSQCCSVKYDKGPSGTCSISDPSCYTDFWYDYYVYANCSAVDSCLGGAQLNAGLCAPSGCEKGGVYKVCCANSGGTCPHSCSGSNYSGTCGSGCYSVIGSSCPAAPPGVTQPPSGGGGGCTSFCDCGPCASCNMSSKVCEANYDPPPTGCRPSNMTWADCNSGGGGGDGGGGGPPSGLSCGDTGGNACGTPSTDSCTNLGNTYDCSPCWLCNPNGTYPPAPPGPGGCVCFDIKNGCGPNRECPAGTMWWEHACQDQSTGVFGCSPYAWGCAPDPNCPLPTPTCNIVLTPSSVSSTIGQSVLIEAVVSSVQNGLVGHVEFTAGDSSVVSLNPSSVSFSPYRTQATGLKAGSTTVSAKAILSPSGSCTSADITVTVKSGPWFQTQGGDIHAQGSLSDDIPSTATDPNLSLKLNNYPGVVSHDPAGQIDLGDGFSSGGTTGNWVASSEYKGKPYGSFDFFKKKYALQMVEENFDGSLSQQDGVYYSKSAQTLSGNWTVPASRWLVIIVEGDVTIPNNIKVNKGGFLAIASSGKITFDGSVAQAQGMFVAETIDTGNSTTAFAGEGIFAANNFNLNRDFADARNQTTPVETFVARPDFLMSSYKNKDENLWWFFQKWQELAP